MVHIPNRISIWKLELSTIACASLHALGGLSNTHNIEDVIMISNLSPSPRPLLFPLYRVRSVGFGDSCVKIFVDRKVPK